MTSTPLSPHYHVGIVVAGLPEAQAQLTEQLGIRWGPVVHFDAAEYRDADGRDQTLPTTFCYSQDDPHIELIEELPGSIWVRNEHSNLHHIGFWSDDVSLDGERLSGSGCPMQFCGRSGADAPWSFAYHGHSLGVRIEIVDASLRPTMESFFFAPPKS